MSGRHRTVALSLVLSTFVATSALAQDNPPAEESRKYHRGALSLAAFAITNIDTTLVVRSEGAPLGVYIDLGKDLGLKDSDAVPRLFFHYRFAKRHRLDFDWFDLDRSNTTELERTIEIGGEVIEAGTLVDIKSKMSIYKALYTWLFYDNDKVSLGASFGFNIFDFDFGVRVDPANAPDVSVDEDAGLAAPLPVIGFRLGYAVTRKLNLGFTADLLVVSIQEYSGTVQDTYITFDYRLSKRFGLGGGINALSINLKVDDDDTLAELRHSYRGFLAAVSIYF